MVTYCQSDPCNHSLAINLLYRVIYHSAIASTMYDEICIQDISKSHIHPWALKNYCRHHNGPIASSCTRRFHHNKICWSQPKQTVNANTPAHQLMKYGSVKENYYLNHAYKCRHINLMLSTAMRVLVNVKAHRHTDYMQHPL